MTSPDVRPVWLTREQRNDIAWLARYACDAGHPIGASGYEVADAWDAAPADAMAAVLANRNVLYATGLDELKGDLRALGFPEREAS